jgi:hypothetical protein
VESNEMTYWFEKFKYDEVFISEFNYHGIEWKWTVYRMTHVKSGRVIEYQKCWDPEQNKVLRKMTDLRRNKLRELVNRIRPDVDVSGWVYRELEVILEGWE